MVQYLKDNKCLRWLKSHFELILYNFLFIFFIYKSYLILDNIDVYWSPIFLLIFNILFLLSSIFYILKVNFNKNIKISKKIYFFIIQWIFLGLILNIGFELIANRNILNLNGISMDRMNETYLSINVLFLILINYFTYKKGFYYFFINIIGLSYSDIILHPKLLYINTLQNPQRYESYIKFVMLCLIEFILLFLIYVIVKIIKIIYNKLRK